MGEMGLFYMKTCAWLGRIAAFIKPDSADLRLVIFQCTKTRTKSGSKMFAHMAHTVFAFKHALKSLFLHFPNP